MKKLACLLSASLMASSLWANVSLPAIFSNNMVLQRNKPIQVWGWANANETVKVQLHNQSISVKTDKKGNWMAVLQPEAAGGPYTLSIKGANQIDINNVLIGEVWLCSGQSNMEMPIAGWGKINDYEAVIAAANDPMIRQFDVANAISTKPLDNTPGATWEVCSPATAGNFSSAAYFYAKTLYAQLKVPIGLINSTWGGTQSEAWTSMEAFEKSEAMKYVAEQLKGKDVQALIKAKEDLIRKNIEQAQGGLDAKPDTKAWLTLAFDDSKWSQMELPGSWEDKGLPGLDGVVWFRRKITLSAADAGKAGQLQLARVDDNDDTYINGVKIGSTQQWDLDRNYTIPAGVLKEGENIITVRVQDDRGGGGIYGDPTHLVITTATQKISLTGNWKYRIESILQNAGGVGPNDYPSLLFNAMIHPLLKYQFKGVIWYQGETNAERGYQYRIAFPLMITDWRTHFKQGDFPFYFVQLSTYGSTNSNSNNGSNWAETRESQALTLSLPNTGMIVTTDIGNPIDIHPKNKQDVGIRLAKLALHDSYGIEGSYCSPFFNSIQINQQTATLTFTHTGSGLIAKDKYGYLKGFEIAGADQRFYPAQALVVNNQVVVKSDQVATPVAVRYNWCDDASEGNLYNKDGFPAAPFRTDNWKTITTNNKYNLLP